MKQKHFVTGTDLPSPNENISVPIGLVRVVEHYLGSAGILDFVDTFKEKGVSMQDCRSYVLIYPQGNNSWVKWERSCMNGLYNHNPYDRS